MAKWDDENFNTLTPPDDIMCATCKYRLKPVTIQGFTQERYNYGACDKFEQKPEDVLWGKQPCNAYEREE